MKSEEIDKFICILIGYWCETFFMLYRSSSDVGKVSLDFPGISSGSGRFGMKKLKIKESKKEKHFIVIISSIVIQIGFSNFRPVQRNFPAPLCDDSAV